MKADDRQPGWDPAGTFLLIAIAGLVVLWQIGHRSNWSGDGAAWVQAIGTLAALFGALFVAWWQVQVARRSKREMVAASLRAKASIVNAGFAFLDLMVAYFSSGATPRPSELQFFYASTRFIFEEVNRIGLHDLPTPQAVNDIVHARRLGEAVLRVVYENEPSSVPLTHDLDVLRDQIEPLRRCANSLTKEAKRLEVGH